MSNLYMPNDRYIAALYRQRDRIFSGIDFVADDSDEIGNKYTHASWGLCSNDKEAWPDAQDHIWPDQFEQRGRVAPKYRKQHQQCPIKASGGNGSGCFYKCQIFKSRAVTRNTRQKAIDLYDAQIARAEKMLGRDS
jgi:hypothetical protein